MYDLRREICGFVICGFVICGFVIWGFVIWGFDDLGFVISPSPTIPKQPRQPPTPGLNPVGMTRPSLGLQAQMNWINSPAD